MRLKIAMATISFLGAGLFAESKADSLLAAPRQSQASAFMRVFGPADPPNAFWRFCDEFPSDCARKRTIESRFNAERDQMIQLTTVNLSVNHAIEPVTDLELYGVSDYWTLPKHGKGDCEDYALLKRHLLMDAGWPASALLITVVMDERNEGHAVLTARTTNGDYILDNKSDIISVWHKTPYRFVMRQSYIDPKAWVALDPAQTQPPFAIAGVEKSQPGSR